MEHHQLTLENFVEFVASGQQEHQGIFEGNENSDRRNDDANGVREDRDNAPQNSILQRGRIDLAAEHWISVDSKVLLNRCDTSLVVGDLKSRNNNFTQEEEIPPFIQNYEELAPSVEHQEKYLRDLVNTEKQKIKALISNYPFSVVLSKKLALMSSILSSLSKKFHCLKYMRSDKTKDVGLKKAKKNLSSGTVKSGTDVLLQMGVKAGLSLLFSLMKQSWMQSTGSSCELCLDVLSTASSITLALPPLSLSNDAKLPQLAKDSLQQVMHFLSDTISGKFPANSEGRFVCVDLLLGLSLQRGSLFSVLEWIEVAVKSSLSANSGLMSWENLNFWLLQIRASRVRRFCSQFIENPRTKENLNYF